MWHSECTLFTTEIPPRPGVISEKKQRDWEKLEEREIQRRACKKSVRDAELDLPGPKLRPRVVWAIGNGFLFFILMIRLLRLWFS